MKDDAFWIEPLEADGHGAIVRSCFNEFAVTISVERRDQGPIREADAERAYTAVMERVPRRVRFRFGRDTQP